MRRKMRLGGLILALGLALVVLAPPAAANNIIVTNLALVNQDTGRPVRHRLDRVLSLLGVTLLITSSNIALASGQAWLIIGLVVLWMAMATWLARSEADVITQAWGTAAAAVRRLSFRR